MNRWEHITAAIILVAVLFVFASPMFNLPATALRAYRSALVLMILIVSAAFVGSMSRDLTRFAIPGESQDEALCPSPLALSCNLRC